MRSYTCVVRWAATAKRSGVSTILCCNERGLSGALHTQRLYFAAVMLCFRATFPTTARELAVEADLDIGVYPAEAVDARDQPQHGEGRRAAQLQPWALPLTAYAPHHVFQLGQHAAQELPRKFRCYQARRERDSRPILPMVCSNYVLQALSSHLLEVREAAGHWDPKLTTVLAADREWYRPLAGQRDLDIGSGHAQTGGGRGGTPHRRGV